MASRRYYTRTFSATPWMAPCTPEAQGLSSEPYEVVSEKVTYRLAQRTSNYVVLKYLREVIKVKQTQALHCPPAPAGVLGRSRTDVSFLAGLLIDKFLYHCPLFRRHQGLQSKRVALAH
jgi:transposase